MRVMAAMSATPAGRMITFCIKKRRCQKKTRREISQKQNAPAVYRGVASVALYYRSAAIAEQTQQHQEEVDEVEIKPQCAHDRFAAADRPVVYRAVHFLDRLSVVGGQAGKHEDADDRNRPIEAGRLEKHVHQ